MNPAIQSFDSARARFIEARDRSRRAEALSRAAQRRYELLQQVVASTAPLIQQAVDAAGVGQAPPVVPSIEEAVLASTRQERGQLSAATEEYHRRNAAISALRVNWDDASSIDDLEEDAEDQDQRENGGDDQRENDSWDDAEADWLGLEGRGARDSFDADADHVEHDNSEFDAVMRQFDEVLADETVADALHDS